MRLIEKYLNWRIRRERKKNSDLKMQVTQKRFRFEILKSNHKNMC